MASSKPNYLSKVSLPDGHPGGIEVQFCGHWQMAFASYSERRKATWEQAVELSFISIIRTGSGEPTVKGSRERGNGPWSYL